MQVNRGERERDDEDKRENEKRQLFKQEIETVWDSSNKLAEVKRELEHDLGIAINDDKIKFFIK